MSYSPESPVTINSDAPAALQMPDMSICSNIDPIQTLEMGKKKNSSNAIQDAQR